MSLRDITGNQEMKRDIDMSRLSIRKYESTDEAGVATVCYKTGFMGDTLHGAGRFNDEVLFTSLFCRYYLRYEPHNCFVLVDNSTNRIAGYVIGSLDTRAQVRRLVLRMGLPIILRAMFYTSWKYPESIRAIFTMIRATVSGKRTGYLVQDLPAHLHINILPEYQGLGMGSQLLDAFEDQTLSCGVVGIHLRTTSRNIKALSFYEKKQYRKISENSASMWPDEESSTLLLGKKLQNNLRRS